MMQMCSCALSFALAHRALAVGDTVFWCRTQGSLSGLSAGPPAGLGFTFQRDALGKYWVVRRLKEGGFAQVDLWSGTCWGVCVSVCMEERWCFMFV
jgi:hypothetical protein